MSHASRSLRARLGAREGTVLYKGAGALMEHGGRLPRHCASQVACVHGSDRLGVRHSVTHGLARRVWLPGVISESCLARCSGPSALAFAKAGLRRGPHAPSRLRACFISRCGCLLRMLRSADVENVPEECSSGFSLAGHAI